MREYFEMWWEQVTGPKRFVDEITKNIKNKVCTVLYVPNNLPWENELRDVIIRNNISNGEWFEIIDDGIEDITEVGNYLLLKFADEKIKTSYAYHSHNTAVEKYLKENKVLSNRILWIKNISSTSLSKWTAFLRKYKSSNNNEGTFILETNEQFNSTGTIRVLKYSKFVTIYDAHLFACLLYTSEAETVRHI